MRLLVIEDNRNLVANLFDYFEARGHTLDAAPDGVTGLHLASTQPYDAVVLDWMLPRLEGPEVLRRLREDGVRVPLDAGEVMPLPGLFMSRVGLACEDAEKIRATQPAKAEQIMATLDGLLAELERRYAIKSGAVPLKRMEFVRVHIGENGERLREETLRASAATPEQGGAR